MTKLGSVLIICLWLAACATGSPALIAPDSVSSPQAWGGAERVATWRNLSFSDQPDEDTFVAASKRGVTTVISLRDPSELEWDEASAAMRQGLRFVSIPIARQSDTLSVEAVSAIDQAIDSQQGQRVLLHCSSGNRAAAWFATHLVTQHRLDAEAAINVAERAGLTRDGLKQRVRTYLNETRP